MYFLNHTCPTVAEDLALDEALLDYVEQTAAAREADLGEGAAPPEFLRLWEARRTAVVLGRSSSLDGEADLPACRAAGVEVLRRTSGGAAVVVGPGCLMYSVVLAYHNHPQLRAIDEAHRYVLRHVVEGVRELAAGAGIRGTSDLAVATPATSERKFSGNALRCRREALLYHGTLLYDFPLAQIGTLLRTPPRQPDYRAGRAHGDFVMNLPAARAAIEQGVAGAFRAEAELPSTLREQLLAEARRLADEKFATSEWTSRVP